MKYTTPPTTGVMKDTPKVVTPTAASSTGTPNPFAALAETPEEAAAETAGAVSEEDIPDDKHLPNQVTTEVIATEVNP